MLEKPPENLENTPPQKSHEEELSPEVLEKVMEKVQDIDDLGVAYSFVSGGPGSSKSLFGSNVFEERTLARILNEGLLGTPDISDNQPSIKEEWTKQARRSVKKGGRSVVYFNITGAAHERERPMTQSKETWINKSAQAMGSGHKLAFIFDLSKFKYDDDTYKMNRKYKETFHKQNHKNFTTSYGFSLSHWVPPRFFNGIVIKHNEEFKNLGRDRAKEPNILYQNLVIDILKIMNEVYQEKKGLLLPIYDIDGNLLWPKQMSYEEVKKFVGERDKNKNKDKEIK